MEKKKIKEDNILDEDINKLQKSSQKKKRSGAYSKQKGKILIN